MPYCLFYVGATTSEKSVGTLLHILYIKTGPEKHIEFVLEKWICVRSLI